MDSGYTVGIQIALRKPCQSARSSNSEEGQVITQSFAFSDLL